MKIKVKSSFGQYNKGQLVTVTDNQGIPNDPYWRRRLKDAAIDKCCEVYKEPEAKVQPKLTQKVNKDD